MEAVDVLYLKLRSGRYGIESLENCVLRGVKVVVYSWVSSRIKLGASQSIRLTRVVAGSYAYTLYPPLTLTFHSTRPITLSHEISSSNPSTPQSYNIISLTHFPTPSHHLSMSRPVGCLGSTFPCQGPAGLARGGRGPASGMSVRRHLHKANRQH